ncbi:hypothetical protein RE628_14685 [Paenibacillus sp. D2_2]|uniref:carbohydrate ABC transporter permease n=1 Tax=Paenibacillus sp. D2_2 TaxID=3073092 RepID=UPI0028154BA7|nr:hypothetical protein [Paenibacillus sp. D2_2]WMT38806.1 hypothetical protein RE628_14685 [Paenibacillus sp. D2_2]
MEPTISVNPKVQRGEFRRFKLSSVFVYIVLTAWAMTTIYPLFWIINNSFKVSRDVMNNSFSVAWHPTLVNYTTALDRINIGKSYVNSLIMSGSTVILVLILGGLAAYVLSRFNFAGKKAIYSLLYATLLIPAFATVVPVYELLIKTSIVNTYWGSFSPRRQAT